MGFYAPAQIVRDARDHGVEILPVCINASRWDCTLEPTDREDRFGERDIAFPLPHGRGDPMRQTARGRPARAPPRGLRARNIYDPCGQIDQIKVKTRDFR